MTNSEKLNEIQKLKYKIEKQMSLIAYYDQMSFSLGGCDFTIERVDCTRNLDAPYVKWIYKKLDAEQKLKEMTRKLKSMINEMTDIIDLIENIDYRMILTFRYVLSKEWLEISETMHLSLSTTYRYHKKGLEEIDALKS